MTGGEAAVALAAVTGLATAAMVVAVVSRKLRRDKREWIAGYRKSRLRSALRSGDGDTLFLLVAQLRQDVGAQAGFAAVLDEVYEGLDQGRRDDLAAAVAATGIDSFLIAQLRSRSPIHRGYAVLLISRLRLREAAHELPPLMSDPDPDVRLAVCAGLTHLRSREAARAMIAGLISRALAKERIIERLGAVWAVPTMIDSIGSEEVTVELVGCDHPDPGWRASVAHALGLAADPRAASVLTAMLRSPDRQERICAARALGPSGTDDSVSALIAALGDPAWEVRAQAAKSLAARGDARAVPDLERCLDSRSWWVRANAADALAELGAAGVEGLRRALRSPDRFARERATEALALHRMR